MPGIAWRPPRTLLWAFLVIVLGAGLICVFSILQHSTMNAADQAVMLGSGMEIRLAESSRPAVLPVVALFARDRGGREGPAIPWVALSGNTADLPYDRTLVETGSQAGQRTQQVLRAIAGMAELFRVEGVAESRDASVAGTSTEAPGLGVLAAIVAGALLLPAAVSALVLSAADRAGFPATLGVLAACRRPLARPGGPRRPARGEGLVRRLPARATPSPGS
ncbi:hypothetical protein [Nonomuraea zeae]|uniref:Uncharacterized protein n=1 Tax=Nonomuraea zeae TaxID=1642303 RepID=A0A5S4G9G4_9ACTN|nr:hypothetical protein [Nonomuraea zeae]TMR29655.1 hypothetical protein ETD85_31660 [Nonomuraea zeae]